jgi:hypothetical protein
MSETEGYRDGVAVWAAAKARAKEAAKLTGGESGALLRQFIHERFLARVFNNPNSQWILKGGNAVLARVNDARTTKDVDLLHELDDLDAALDQLGVAVTIDLGDHFRFVITGHDTSLGGTGQPHVDGYRVHVDTYCGAVKRHTFGVDLVTGSLMTTAAEVDTTTPVLDLRGMSSPPIRLYPVVDHVADKLCATQASYGTSDHPSSRVRDLVDIVVLARSRDVDGDSLIGAIHAEWVHRGLDGEPVFAPPASWDRLYPPIARKVRACDGLTGFAAAVEFVGGFLGPALDGSASKHKWSASRAAWYPLEL